MSLPAVSHAQAGRFRFERAGLGGGFQTANQVARAALGVQAQFEPSGGLSIRGRLPDFAAASLETALLTERSLVKTWGQRATLHLYDVADWALFTAALGDAGTWWSRRLEKEKARLPAFQRALAAAEAWLLEEGRGCTREELRAALPALAEWFEFSSGPLFDLARRGLTCHAGWDGPRTRFAHRAIWLPDLVWEPPSPRDARAELARRYLASYGPADARDFAFWLGIKAGPAREAFAAIASETVAVDLQGQTVRARTEDLESLTAPVADPRDWSPRLLHRYDTLLLSLKDKSWLVDPAHYKQVWKKAGVVEAVILLEGRIAGVWRYDKVAGGVAITLAPFGKITKPVRRQLEAEASGLMGYFELEVVEQR